MLVEANPRSVQTARRWVVDACRDLGRRDLMPCAELGVSELLTNALIHGEPPIRVRVRGTRDHPRIEVADGSHRLPVLAHPVQHEALLTVGRGMGIVARSAVAWGADLEGRGKVVWFEPAQEVSGERWVEPAITRSAVASQSGGPSGRLVAVRLLRVPARLFVDLHNLYRELRRELRLLALAHGDDYPVARRLNDTLTTFEREYPGDARDVVDSALESGMEVVDLTVGVAPTAGPVFDRTIEALAQADQFCRDERLLTLARTDDQVAFQKWYLGEFVRQSDGQPPEPWDGQGCRWADPTGQSAS